MSRPTAMERAQADAKHIKSLTAYAEICMVQEALDGVITRELSRFGDSEVHYHLKAIGVYLERVRQEAETRTRAR